jgi:type IV pilus assembly protein PilV
MGSTPGFHRPPSTGSGFTIIEVLIAIFVLTVGLLGVAGMQMIGLKNNNNAALRTQAVFLAQDIADRMRANPGALATYAATPNCASVCSPGSGCSPAELANYDRCAWDDAVSQLPGGQGQITSLANNVYQVTIMWDDQKTGVTGTGCSGDPTVDLLCFITQFRP